MFLRTESIVRQTWSPSLCAAIMMLTERKLPLPRSRGPPLRGSRQLHGANGFASPKKKHPFRLAGSLARAGQFLPPRQRRGDGDGEAGGVVVGVGPVEGTSL